MQRKHCTIGRAVKLKLTIGTDKEPWTGRITEVRPGALPIGVLLFSKSHPGNLLDHPMWFNPRELEPEE